MQTSTAASTPIKAAMPAGTPAAMIARSIPTIGVNQRDLYTFEVDPDRAERMAKAIPTGMVKVAESGIRDAQEDRWCAEEALLRAR